MEALVALGIGLLAGAGVWLALARTGFSVLLGLTLLSYAVNFLLFASGRLDRLVPPIALPGAGPLADPLPQALVLTAIVIGFGMTAYLVALILRAAGAAGDDRLDRDGEGP
ncbi:Na+/H+ antiporter subunit C [Thermaurantiacus sp.]